MSAPTRCPTCDTDVAALKPVADDIRHLAAQRKAHIATVDRLDRLVRTVSADRDKALRLARQLTAERAGHAEAAQRAVNDLDALRVAVAAYADEIAGGPNRHTLMADRLRALLVDVTA